MYDAMNDLYHLILSLQMETGNVPDQSNSDFVSIVLQNVMDRYGTDQKAIRYNGNIVLNNIVWKHAYSIEVINNNKNY